MTLTDDGFHEAVKPWYRSKTVWAALVTIVASLAGLFGIALPADAQAGLADTLVSLATSMAGLVALIGRLSAKSRIG